MLTILHRDPHVVAIDKPAGLLTHRSDLDRNEIRFAVQLLRDQIGARVHPVHRLDRGTSGVLLFALDADTAGALGRQFEAGEVRKRYLAVVRGWPAPSGSITHALSRDADGERSPALPPQAAQTDYRRLAAVELPYAVGRYPAARYALMDLVPHTGRHHQLRRHMKHIAHPIIGDATHGKGVHNRFFRDRLGCGRLLLACVEMRFRHPQSARDTLIRALPDGSFADLLERLGWSAEMERYARDLAQEP